MTVRSQQRTDVELKAHYAGRGSGFRPALGDMEAMGRYRCRGAVAVTGGFFHRLAFQSFERFNTDLEVAGMNYDAGADCSVDAACGYDADCASGIAVLM